MTVPEGIKAGKISKPYGIRGEVQIILIPFTAQHIIEGNPLLIDLDGQRVPFFMESVDLVSQDQAIIKFEFIDTVDEARKVAGCDVYLDTAHAPEPAKELVDLQKVVGYQAYDLKLGSLGKVMEYVSHEMNPVWLIGFSEKEIMVPAIKELVRKIDHSGQELHLDLPEGITEL
jgi:16S rRNA processing protein RimM